VHVYGFGALLASVAVFTLVSTVLQVVMSERRRRWTSKLQRLNAALVSLSSLRCLEFYSAFHLLETVCANSCKFCCSVEVDAFFLSTIEFRVINPEFRVTKTKFWVRKRSFSLLPLDAMQSAPYCHGKSVCPLVCLYYCSAISHHAVANFSFVLTIQLVPIAVK